MIYTLGVAVATVLAVRAVDRRNAAAPALGAPGRSARPAPAPEHGHGHGNEHEHEHEHGQEHAPEPEREPVRARALARKRLAPADADGCAEVETLRAHMIGAVDAYTGALATRAVGAYTELFEAMATYFACFDATVRDPPPETRAQLDAVLATGGADLKMRVRASSKAVGEVQTHIAQRLRPRRNGLVTFDKTVSVHADA
jgi:hypothetical protein